jgi:hypothetical protein
MLASVKEENGQQHAPCTSVRVGTVSGSHWLSYIRVTPRCIDGPESDGFSSRHSGGQAVAAGLSSERTSFSVLDNLMSASSQRLARICDTKGRSHSPSAPTFAQ